jgi:hypothetical protein
MTKSKQWCMADDDIDDCKCERLQDDFTGIEDWLFGARWSQEKASE